MNGLESDDSRPFAHRSLAVGRAGLPGSGRGRTTCRGCCTAASRSGRSRGVDVDVRAITATPHPITEYEVRDDRQQNQYDDRPDPARAAPIRAWSIGDLYVRHVSPEVDVERRAAAQTVSHRAPKRPRHDHIADSVPAMSSARRKKSGARLRAGYRLMVTPAKMTRPGAGS